MRRRPPRPEPRRRSTAAPKPAKTEAGAKLSNKTTPARLKKLHVELVKLQEWVVKQGLKVASSFEGRDGAGKGGTIKAITERLSPRVFRRHRAARADRSARRHRCTASVTCRTCRRQARVVI